MMMMIMILLLLLLMMMMMIMIPIAIKTTAITVVDCHAMNIDTIISIILAEIKSIAICAGINVSVHAIIRIREFG